MTAISMLRETFWLWDSQLLPVERWSDLDGRKLAQAHLREAGKPTREGRRPLGLPMGRMSIEDGERHLSGRALPRQESAIPTRCATSCTQASDENVLGSG